MSPIHDVIDAEQAVLGGLMLAPDALDKVADRLGEDDFYRRDHRLIWRAITELANKGMPCDAVTLGDWFEANGLAEMVGGASYLIELANSTPSAANIAAYSEIVREHADQRRLEQRLRRLADLAGNRPARDTLGEVSGLLDSRTAIQRGECMPTAVPMPAPGEILPEVDFVLPGLPAGMVGLLIGAGGAGKTTLAMQIAIGVALGRDIATGPAGSAFSAMRSGSAHLVCGEDPPAIITRRLAGIRDAMSLTADEREALTAGALRVESAVGVDLRCLSAGRGGSYSPGPFLAGLRRLCAGRRLVVIDPLARLHDADESSNAAMTQLMRHLAAVAHITGAAILLVHHAGKVNTAAAGGTTGDDWARARGASALTTSARAQYDLRGPSAEERRGLGITDPDAWRWCRLASAKSNYSEPTPPIWLRRNAAGILSCAFPGITSVDEYPNRRDTGWTPVRRGRRA